MPRVKQIITAREVARILGRTPATIEHALREGTFPVGTAYKTASGRYVYIIPLEAFERFLRGEISG